MRRRSGNQTNGEVLMKKTEESPPRPSPMCCQLPTQDFSVSIRAIMLEGPPPSGCERHEGGKQVATRPSKQAG